MRAKIASLNVEKEKLEIIKWVTDLKDKTAMERLRMLRESPFKLGVLIQEMREQLKLTQEQLAAKCGTTKSYISRIENNASDIRLSTLMRIIQKGLGGHLNLSVSY